MYSPTVVLARLARQRVAEGEVHTDRPVRLLALGEEPRSASSTAARPEWRIAASDGPEEVWP